MNDKNKLLKICGIFFILLTLSSLIELIITIVTIFSENNYSSYNTFYDTLCNIYNILYSIISIVGYAFVSFSCLTSNHKFMLIGYLGIIEIALLIMKSIYTIIYIITITVEYDFSYALGNCVLLPCLIFKTCAILLLLFYCLNQINESEAVSSNNISDLLSISNNTNEQINQINKLQKLLEIGAISQEDFNFKKKQILGM